MADNQNSMPMDKYRIFVVGGNQQVKDMFISEGHTIVDNLSKPFDIAVFTGGSDVLPILYGQRLHPKTNFSVQRDLEDSEVFHGLPIDKPKIGICRGAQFLCVKSGGSLWQNVDGHTSYHDIEMFDGTVIKNVASTHHQMMIPPKDSWTIWTAIESTTRESVANDGSLVKYEPDWEKDPDPEVVFLYGTNSLCVQPHPEYNKDPFRKEFFRLVYEYFDKDVYPQKYINKRQDT